MRAAAVWRSPVKSMAGERVEAVAVTADGVAGAREYAFESDAAPPGMLRVSGRERGRLLGFRASGVGDAVRVEAPDGESFPVAEAGLLAALGLLGGRLVRAARPQTDCRPLALISLATMAAVDAEFGTALDWRQYRANFLLDGVEAWGEEAWAGQRVRVGGAVVEVTERDPRCRFFSLDPGTGVAMPALMKWLDWKRQGRVGVYARVVEPGWVAAGDEVRVEA